MVICNSNELAILLQHTESYVLYCCIIKLLQCQTFACDHDMHTVLAIIIVAYPGHTHDYFSEKMSLLVVFVRACFITITIDGGSHKTYKVLHYAQGRLSRVGHGPLNISATLA